MTRRPFARFLRWLGTIMAGYFIITTAITTTVDPWRINAAPWAINALDGARDLYNNRRVGKAALANRGNWRVVILGSSRIEIGLDPASPVFHGRPAVNLGMSAASLYENLAVGNYALDRNPHIDTLLLGIDPGDLFSDQDSRGSNHFYQSPFADNNRSIERSINQLIGWNALVDSFGTLSRQVTGRPPRFSPLGRMQEPSGQSNLRKFVEAAFIETSVGQWSPCPELLRQAKADALTAFIHRARQAGIAMYIVIPPQHALKQIHPTKDLPATMGWETDLLALADICRKANATATKGPPVQVWSFLTFNAFTCQPMPDPAAADQSLPGWLDLGHFEPALGDRMFQTLFAAPSNSQTPPAGINLLEGDWNTHCRAWCLAHRDYCVAHPQEVAWWRGLMARRVAKSVKAEN